MWHIEWRGTEKSSGTRDDKYTIIIIISMTDKYVAANHRKNMILLLSHGQTDTEINLYMTLHL